MEGVVLGFEKSTIYLNNGTVINEQNCVTYVQDSQENLVYQPIEVCRDTYCIYSFPTVSKDCSLIGYVIVFTTRPLTEDEIQEWIDYLKTADLSQFEIVNEESLATKIFFETLKEKVEALTAMLGPYSFLIGVLVVLFIVLIIVSPEFRSVVQDILFTILSTVINVLLLVYFST